MIYYYRNSLKYRLKLTTYIIGLMITGFLVIIAWIKNGFQRDGDYQR